MSDVVGSGEIVPHSAEIIAFPIRLRALAVPPADTAEADARTEAPRERLQRALALLQAAQEEQRLAVAKWRAAIAGLDSSLQALRSTAQSYQQHLADLTTAREG